MSARKPRDNSAPPAITPVAAAAATSTSVFSPALARKAIPTRAEPAPLPEVATPRTRSHADDLLSRREVDAKRLEKEASVKKLRQEVEAKERQLALATEMEVLERQKEALDSELRNRRSRLSVGRKQEEQEEEQEEQQEEQEEQEVIVTKTTKATPRAAEPVEEADSGNSKLLCYVFLVAAAVFAIFFWATQVGLCVRDRDGGGRRRRRRKQQPIWT